MISFLILLLIMVLVFGLLYWAFTLLPLPEPFKNIALVILILIFIIYLLAALGGAVPLPKWSGVP